MTEFYVLVQIPMLSRAFKFSPKVLWVPDNVTLVNVTFWIM